MGAIAAIAEKVAPALEGATKSGGADAASSAGPASEANAMIQMLESAVSSLAPQSTGSNGS